MTKACGMRSSACHFGGFLLLQQKLVVESLMLVSDRVLQNFDSKVQSVIWIVVCDILAIHIALLLPFVLSSVHYL